MAPACSVSLPIPEATISVMTLRLFTLGGCCGSVTLERVTMTEMFLYWQGPRHFTTPHLFVCGRLSHKFPGHRQSTSRIFNRLPYILSWLCDLVPCAPEARSASLRNVRAHLSTRSNHRHPEVGHYSSDVVGLCYDPTTLVG